MSSDRDGDLTLAVQFGRRFRFGARDERPSRLPHVGREDRLGGDAGHSVEEFGLTVLERPFQNRRFEDAAG